MLPKPRLARQIIDVLGQSGTPLSKGVPFAKLPWSASVNRMRDARAFGPG
jgi:hypothetical protein